MDQRQLCKAWPHSLCHNGSDSAGNILNDKDVLQYYSLILSILVEERLLRGEGEFCGVGNRIPMIGLD